MINVAVEGQSDVEIARTVVRAAGREVAQLVVKQGKTNLDPLLAKYNRASRHTPWVVFRDTDTHCPRTLRDRLLIGIDQLSPTFLLRLVHPMSEAWLLADRAGFAEYFSVRQGRIPSDPELLQHPKRTVLALCAESRSRAIRSDMVLPDGRTGQLYTYRLNEFSSAGWNVDEAAVVSDSLRRAIVRIAQVPMPADGS